MIGAIIAKQKVQEKFAARNRGDIDAFLSDWSDDATFIFPGQSETSGTFHGMHEIRPWFENFRRQFPKVNFEVKQIFVRRIWAMGATNELAVQWKSTLWNQQGEVNQNQGVTVVHIRNGKLVLAQDFIFDLSPSFFQASQPA
jgi:ketosteroid isomerase-like protein